MRFGTFNILGWEAEAEQDAVIERGVERIVYAEELGFSSAWLTEHHFANDPAYDPYGFTGADCRAYDLSVDPLTILTFAAARTSRIRLGTGVIVLPFDNPVRVAERTALLDVLSKGRLEVGLGRGGGHREPAAFHVSPQDSRDVFSEALDVLIAAWIGKPFRYEGRFYQVPEIAVVPHPRQQPHPPVYLAATSPESFAWAGRRGFPFAYVGGAWGPITHDTYARQQNEFLDAAHAAGHRTDGMEFPHVLLMYCAASDGEANEVAERHVLRHLIQAEGHYEHRRYPGQIPARLAGRTGPGQVIQTARDTIALNLIGTPETCIRRIESYVDAVGLNYLLVCADFGSLPHELAMRSMERFATHVAPVFTPG
jgi:alkanesulfonate monooxygenase SsuD/methylene tetrahydromethanopterin reductase-like flavin-dependent oxidoreductase (luciferase family)